MQAKHAKSLRKELGCSRKQTKLNEGESKFVGLNNMDTAVLSHKDCYWCSASIVHEAKVVNTVVVAA